MEPLVKKRTSKLASLTRLENYYNHLDQDNINFVELKLHLSKLEECSNTFEISHENIIVKSKDADAPQHEQIMEDFENRSISLKSKLLNLMKNEPAIPTATQDTNSTKGTADIRLPLLDLPTFNFNEWLSFRDLFTTTINENTKLSGAQKLQYLKASVKGEAAQLLQSIQITDDNFLEAWDILKLRYSNQREILHSNLKRFFGQEKLTRESSIGIRKLLDVSSECLRAMKILKQPTEHWDTIIIFIIAGKLDAESRREWELSLKTDDIPDWNAMYNFLDQRARALSAAGSSKNKVIAPIKFNMSQINKSTSVHYGATYSCELCSDKHAIYQCAKFLELTVPERKDVVKKHNRCSNCLNKSHSILNCNSKYTCKTCHKKHNSLLHINIEKPNSTEGVPDNIGSHFSSKIKVPNQVLLSTANVLITDVHGNPHQFRALLDNGSQSSFISEKSLQLLQLPTSKVNIPISGLASASIGSVKKQVHLRLLSSLDKEFALDVNAFVLTNITGQQPNNDIQLTDWPHIKGFPLADPKYFQSSNIDILLGGDVYPEVILGGKVTGPEGSPTGFNTVFGLTLLGKLNIKNQKNIQNCHVQCDVDNIIQVLAIRGNALYKNTNNRRKSLRNTFPGNYFKKIGWKICCETSIQIKRQGSR